MLHFIQHYSVLFIYPLVALTLSAVFTWCAIRILPRLGFVRSPGGRHIHKTPVPRGGGIAVILSFFIALAMYALDARSTADTNLFFWKLLLPAAILMVLGLFDDRYELRSWTKLLVQILVAVIIFKMDGCQYTVCGWRMPLYLSLPATILWIIIVVNAFNLIDGLDGLASGLAVISASCMTIWFLLVGNHMKEAVTFLILAGSALGFLRYNFHPAKIFLGDTGSMFLGFVFAVLSLSTVDRAVTMTSLLLPLLAIGVPLFDVILAVWRRSARKLSNPESGGIMEGDQDHLHHRLLRQTNKQTTTAIYLYLVACAFAGIALLFVLIFRSEPLLAYLVLILAVISGVRHLAGVEIFHSACLIQKGLEKPKRGLLVYVAHPFIDFAVINFSFLLVMALLMPDQTNLRVMGIAIVPAALLLWLSGIYKVYWLRAGIDDYYYLASVIISGSFLSAVCLYSAATSDMIGINVQEFRFFLAAVLLFTLLNLTLICSERFLLHYAESFWFRKLSNTCGNVPPAKLLIYGGGMNCRLFVNYLYNVNSTWSKGEIIGILDDDVALYRKRIFGFEVLGGIEDIKQIFEKKPFDKLVVTTNSIRARELKAMVKFAKEKNIRLTMFRADESPLENYITLTDDFSEEEGKG